MQKFNNYEYAINTEFHGITCKIDNSCEKRTDLPQMQLRESFLVKVSVDSLKFSRIVADSQGCTYIIAIATCKPLVEQVTT